METSSGLFTAFFSYVRLNDEHDKGKLTLLRKMLETEVWVQTGSPLRIFQDQEHIEWGQDWMEKIKNVLGSCSIFIAVITPSYLMSQSCRFEFNYFLEKESQLKRKLILPILYIDTPGLRDERDDVAVKISKRQWIDWRDLRFSSLTSTKVNKEMASSAIQIRDLVNARNISKSSSPEPNRNEKDKGAPPPDNFPDGWDSEWQPAFEHVVVAAPPKPRLTKKEENTRNALVTSIHIPLPKSEEKDYSPKRITVDLHSSGDKAVDRRRIKTIYGTLISFHGQDRFSFQVFENDSNSRHLIEFQNDTTRVCPELLNRLRRLLGEECWQVEEITFQ